jgi:arabinogalactan oligomer/maltooligosaccharide transport system permease protein
MATTTAGMIVKIAVLALVLAIAIFAAFPLIEQRQWLGLGLLVLVTAVLFWVYLSPRRIPAKYLVPGTLFLLAFQVFPVLYTMSTAFTNFGDAHRGSKQDAIQAIEGASVTKVPGSTDYRLSVATRGDPVTGDLVFLLVDPETRAAQLGTPDGLEPLAADGLQFSAQSNITEAPGYTILSIGQAGAREEDLADFNVPTPDGAIVPAGGSPAPSRAPPSGPTTRPATASRTPRRARPGPPTTTTACSSTPRASTWPRAGGSTSACATSPPCSPTR